MSIVKYYFYALLLVGVDQLTKILIFAYIAPGDTIVINDYFSLAHVHNHGAAFSFLADASGWQKYFLSSVSFIVSIVIIVWMYKTNSANKIKLIALATLLGGALGNLYDRVFLGMVVDFIDLHYQTFYYPVFNMADVFIFIGVVCCYFLIERPNE